MTVSIFDSSIDIINRLKDLVYEAAPHSSIQHATRYEEALVNVENLKPDIVVLDINFHNNDSYTLLHKIKTNFKDTIVIVLSVEVEERVQKKCAQLGADYFFDKYHQFDQVPEIISSIIENTKPKNC